MADTVIENLITKLSFEFDDDKLNKFDDFLKNATKGLVAVVAGATAAATAIFVFTKKIAEANDELGKFARRTGIDIKALQELGYVAELNGGSIDSMNSSLENLSRIASEASRGVGAGVEVFGMLGVSVTNANGKVKNADVLLNNVSDAIARLGTQAERLEFAQKLGIGSDLLLTIQQGSEAIKKQREEAKALGFSIDQNAAKAAADFNDELLKLNKVILGIANAIGTKLMKQITPMIKLFIEWFKINKEIIKQNLIAFLNKTITVIRGVFNIIMRVVNIVMSLVNAMGGLKNAIIVVTGLLLVMNASALLMPILLVAAGVAILLILEDIIKFAEGGDSAIGNLAERFPILETALWGLLDILAMIRDGWIAIFQDGGLFIEELILMFQELGETIKNFVLIPINKAIELFNKIPSIDSILGGLSKKGKIGEIASNLIGSALGRTNQEREQASQSLETSNTSNTSNTTNTNQAKITLNINGGDTEEVKRVVTDVLNQQYSGAQDNLTSQVAY